VSEGGHELAELARRAGDIEHVHLDLSHADGLDEDRAHAVVSAASAGSMPGRD
jgi:hypothetical protein